MKKFLAMILVGVMVLSCIGVSAEDTKKLPDVLKTANERYAESIKTAIENSKFFEEEIDKESIYIVEIKRADSTEGLIDTDVYHVALPASETEHVRFTYFNKGVRGSESMNTLSFIDKMETHLNTKIETYISDNKLENVTEAINTKINISFNSGVRAHVNAYKVLSCGETFYIPYYTYKNYNIANEESCALEYGKAYTEADFKQILKAEMESYAAFKEAEKKAEEERLKAEAKAEEEKYTPLISLDENGNKIVKVNGVNLDDIMVKLEDSIEKMAFASSVKMKINRPDEDYMTTYRWQKGCNVKAINKFASGLFDELKTQVTAGKPSPRGKVSYCHFGMKHDEGFKSITYNVKISVWEDGVEITTDFVNSIEFKARNPETIIDYIERHSNNNFEGFSYEMYDENTPYIKGNLEGLSTTDVIEFEFTLPSDTDNDISTDVASPGTTVNGTFEKYQGKNKNQSTYILTLSGNRGNVSFCLETQSSFSGEQEIFSNNIPVYFSNTTRFEDGDIVEYKIGKIPNSYAFKMIFKSNDIYETYFDDIKCTNLKYTQLTEDIRLIDEYKEKDKEALIKEENKSAEKERETVMINPQQCADALYDFGLFKGTDKGYELEKSLTREQSATILVRLLGEENKLDADDFDEVFVDIDRERWSYAYVMYCFENGITKGTGKDTFSPDAEIDASQFITLLMRLLGYAEVNPDTALEKSVEYKLLPDEKIDELTKKKTFTRSDMVQIVYNSLKTQMVDKTIFAEYLVDKGIITKSEAELIK